MPIIKYEIFQMIRDRSANDVARKFRILEPSVIFKLKVTIVVIGTYVTFCNPLPR